MIWFGENFCITVDSQSEKQLTCDPVHLSEPQDLISNAIQRCEAVFGKVPKRVGLLK